MNIGKEIDARAALSWRAMPLVIEKKPAAAFVTSRCRPEFREEFKKAPPRPSAADDTRDGSARMGWALSRRVLEGFGPSIVPAQQGAALQLADALALRNAS